MGDLALRPAAERSRRARMARRRHPALRVATPRSAARLRGALACRVARTGRREARGEAADWFVELVPGTEDVAERELRRLGATRLDTTPGGALVAGCPAPKLVGARTVAAVYRRLTFAVPRPKALLGDEAFRRLAGACSAVAGKGGAGTGLSGGPFSGLRLAAAGADSPVLTRLAAELARTLGLPHRPDDGDFLVRLRRDPGTGGWEALVRLTRRPSTAREWRVCNRPGGLNAAVAVVMNELVRGGRDSGGQAVARPAEQRYLNLMCGSGTLLAERALAGPAARLVGVDIEPEATECAALNLAAAGVRARCELITADALTLQASELGRFHAITADLPWGDAVGTHAGNRAMYPRLLRVAFDLAVPGALFALLTHEVKLARSVLAAQSEWRVRSERQVEHGGHNPLLLTLERS